MHEIRSKTQSKIINVIYTLHTSTIQCIHLKVNALTDVRRLFSKKFAKNARIKCVKTTKAFFYPIYDIICVVQLKRRGSIRGSHEGLNIEPQFSTSRKAKIPPPPKHATTHKRLTTRARHSTSMQHIFI